MAQTGVWLPGFVLGIGGFSIILFRLAKRSHARHVKNHDSHARMVSLREGSLGLLEQLFLIAAQLT